MEIKVKKICKDGRIWGQNNKEAGSHLGILTGRKKVEGISKGRLKKHWWRTDGSKGHIPWNKGIKRTDIAGSKHPNWKGGISKTKEWKRERNKIWRLRNPEKAKYYSKLDKHKRRAVGYISIKIIQSIYEDNIKEYGTLTCIYCLNPIAFGKDTLEHKNPISRGGTNTYENLAIACFKCNINKKAKTYDEYKKEREVKNGQSFAS